MANIEEKVINIIPQITKAVVTSMSEMTDIICKILEERRDDKVAKDILGYAKDGGNISFVAFDGMVGNDFKRALSLAGVSFVEGTTDSATKNVLFIKECDEGLVKQIKRDILLNRGRINELTIQEILNKSYGKKMGIIKDVDDVMMTRIRSRAKENHVIFAAEKNNSGKNNVYYDISDKKMMNYVLFRAAWDINGKVGKENAKRIEYDLEKKKEFGNSLTKKEDRYIVSAINPRNYIHVSENGIDVYENDRLKDSRERISDNFDIYAYYQYEKLVNPVNLNKEEYFSTNVHDTIEQLNKRPIISQETKELWKKEEFLRELVEKKMSLDNGYQLENESSLYNREVAFSEFFEHEIVNDEHDRENEQIVLNDLNEEEIKVYIEQIQSTMIVQESFEFESVSVDAKSIDSIINEFESQKDISVERTSEDRSL